MSEGPDHRPGVRRPCARARDILDRRGHHRRTLRARPWPWWQRRVCAGASDDAPFIRRDLQESLGVEGIEGIETRIVWGGNIIRHPMMRRAAYRTSPEGPPGADAGFA